MDNNNLITYLIIILLLSLSLSFSGKSFAADVDVMVVYTGENKELYKSIKKELSGNLKIKSYNASLLMMADYSGKQKATAKISTAALVVIITEKPMELLGNPEFSNSVIVSGDGEEELRKIRSSLTGRDT